MYRYSIEEIEAASRITWCFPVLSKNQIKSKHKTQCLFTDTRTHIEQTSNLKVCTSYVQHKESSL